MSSHIKLFNNLCFSLALVGCGTGITISSLDCYGRGYFKSKVSQAILFGTVGGIAGGSLASPYVMVGAYTTYVCSKMAEKHYKDGNNLSNFRQRILEQVNEF